MRGTTFYYCLLYYEYTPITIPCQALFIPQLKNRLLGDFICSPGWTMLEPVFVLNKQYYTTHYTDQKAQRTNENRNEEKCYMKNLHQII